ncbi:hypothetical protein K7432_014143 [Basidiobolus ranarum]|uniref:Transmembrane protein 198 n=1 Tax=Basidiobolus ranarum TaxID=34480 RepID=A0ABR2VPV4_9FUNG
MLCFFGRKWLSITLFITGFMVGAIICYIILLSQGFYLNNQVQFALICIGSGVIIASIFAFFGMVFVAAIGGLGGFTLAMVILSFGDGLLIQNEIGRGIFIGILVFLGIALGIFSEHHVIILSTSLSGTYNIIVGLDYFIKTGLLKHIVAFVSGESTHFYHTTAKVYLLLGALLVLFGVSVFTQYRMFNRQLKRARGSVQFFP